jgi:hypothetical protein
MLPISILNTTVTIKRRESQGRDSLNNPDYGAPTSGAGWNVIYTAIPVRLAFSSKLIKFAAEGERVEPTGIVYLNAGYTICPEDHVVTSSGDEYTVISIIEATAFGSVIDHLELVIELP